MDTNLTPPKAEGKCEACGGHNGWWEAGTVWVCCKACPSTGRAPAAKGGVPIETHQSMVSALVAEVEKQKAGWGEAFRLGVYHQERADKAEAALAQRDAEIARLRAGIKAAFHELGGIGRDSSKGFHRIGIDSARGILDRSTTSGAGRK